MKQYRMLYLAFGAALLVLAALVYLSHRNLSQWTLSDQREAYTFSVIQRMDRLLGELASLSRSQRDYQRTGEPEHLASFRQVQKQLEQELASLRELSRQHAKLERWLSRIEPLVRERLAERELALSARPGEQAARGRTSSEQIRREVAAAQEQAILELRELSARQVRQLNRVQGLLVADAAFIFLLILAVFFLLRRDVAARLRRERELVEHRDELEGQVRTRTAELESANEELRRERRLVEETRRDLAAHQDAIREEERLALARELHDEVGQNLTALKLDLSWMERRVPAQGELAGRIRALLGRLDDLIDTTRHISAELRPPMLDNLGLAAALEWQADEFRRSSGIECDLTLSEGLPPCTPQAATNLLRICQEALTNVVRHAGATEVFISLRGRGDRLALEVSDNGCGASRAQIDSPTAYGIMGMRERARLCGGELSITGGPEEGTTLRLEIPALKEEA